MQDTARYAKIVEWSEEDQCFAGSSPGLIYALYRQDRKALPPPTSGRDCANKMQNVA